MWQGCKLAIRTQYAARIVQAARVEWLMQSMTACAAVFYARGVQPRAGFREASSEFSAILAAIQSRETVVARREQDACAEARAAEAIRA